MIKWVKKFHVFKLKKKSHWKVLKYLEPNENITYQNLYKAAKVVVWEKFRNINIYIKNKKGWQLIS